ncbi:hypothetical protein LXT21_18420 [Myxococcus sp. K38C18041901]|uniref:hypothetical protein n=1 Tax=Myxococcus guangdongensis TaxID=2906760 RepID=UPI0020A83668|nr:hypothetical protein [Myxococcus guangdongensis]MCP3060764.1 hypothetical protein [Myxococcus guangdongensis]
MRGIVMTSVLVILWMTGCDGAAPEAPAPSEPPSTEDFFRSGSRLRFEVTTTRDGLRWPGNLFDPERGTVCHWRRAAPDGAFYCVSGVAQQGILLRGAETGDFFADADCTQRLWLTSSREKTEPFIALRSAPPEQLPRFFTRGEPFTGTVHTRTQGGDCVRRGSSPGVTAFHVGPEVPAGTFVRGELRERHAGPGIATVFIEGEDGSSHFDHLRATEHDLSCIAGLASDDVSRCLPLPLNNPMASGPAPHVWANETCTEPAYQSLSCTLPRLAVHFESKQCTPRIHVLSVKERLTQTHLQQADGTCQPTVLASPCYVRAGEEIPAQTWPEAIPIDLKTHGRLTVRGLSLAHSAVIPTALFDPQVGMECRFAKDVEGRSRCLPSSLELNFAGIHADEACTQPLLESLRDECRQASFATLRDASTGGFRVHATGPRHDGVIFKQFVSLDGSTQCFEMARQPGATYWRVGAEIPATSFVLGEPTVE